MDSNTNLSASDAQINAEIVVLAVAWNEIQGPEIISQCPADGLFDPVNISLQIYLSSVAVFGQHRQTKKVDFSLPLLSISENHLVRVAFDSWPDNIRGDERPFFLGFIMDKETDNLINNDLSARIWNYMSEFKEIKLSYNVQNAYEEISNILRNRKKEVHISSKQTTGIPIEDQDYSILQAVRDIEIASDLWTRKTDRNALPLALKSAYKLEKQDFEHAGHAFFLAGNIFFQTGELESSLDMFLKSTEAFKSANDLSDASEAMFNVAVLAFRLQKYDIAKVNLLLSSEMISDTNRKARMFLQLAQTYVKLREFDSAMNYFELAAENALRNNNFHLAADILSQLAFRLGEKAVEIVDKTYQRSLLEHAARTRERAAQNYALADENVEAGRSFVLASKSYLQIMNESKTIANLNSAKTYFLKSNDFTSTSRVMLDIITLTKDNPQESERLGKEALDYIEKISDLNVRNSLLGRALRELARVSLLQGNGWATYTYYKRALEELNLNSVDYTPTVLAFANFLFQIEDYKYAGELFEILSKRLEYDQLQAQKSLKNAHLSFKHAVVLYLQIGNGSLLQRNFDDAINSYIIAIDLMNKSYETVPPDELDSLKKWLESLVKTIKQKYSLFRNEDILKITNNLKKLPFSFE